ncbi:solute carrier family 28 member 3-like isoform X1 [Actinia tenebrosa]|uniref:Sodium/nucleoside cotransporter n=1 Tax=Actinia tenebrosa TaxID=6105 RepID=A0A6P8H855_ACTTE|nr:solute carrier family 28 member 3-like isoform X1 [Actinia tenebrosa]XP_031548620.1 solute carrier family 28 member 3-like isoform X1 [Actinia tenebrosa]XP_031548623.1 solute carrier family 28 member 3-like isoform X1 [Actinia tenebrosa]XP_031548624.1 solute carrier family 28 member 3-like isoform X1 [Actinia tenebrosa]
MEGFDSKDNISYSTPKKSAPKNTINFNDSGIDGRSSDDSAMTDQLEMSGIADSKKALKIDDDDSPLPTRRIKTQVFVDIPEMSKFGEIWRRHNFNIVTIIITNILLVYSIIAICISGFKKVQVLFGLTMVLWFCLIYMFIREHWGDAIYRACIKPCVAVINSQWKWLKWLCILVILALIGVFLGLDTAKEPERFISVAGLFVNISICWLFSARRSKIKWRPVLWGLGLQFIFGLLILRTPQGFATFKFLGQTVQSFLDFTDVGAKFVFGDDFMKHFFAFKVLPVIVFFSSFISVCYYIGIMQVVIKKVAWLMQVTMATSAVESLNAAGNIFVGQTEAPLLVRPFLSHVTKSELHAIMTGGFATIAGGVLAAYIEFGVSASHLLSASVMSAPAALAISKLLYPETDKPETLDEDIHLPSSGERNVIEAAAKGASTAIALVANIAANLIAFLAFLAFFNAILSWLGSMVGHPEISFEYICSYLLRPVAFLMGVQWKDCDVVAELLGIKTFLNEFVAYIRLSGFITNRRKEIGDARTISVRSEILATYALCGFSNFSSIGIQIGGLGPMAPTRTGDMAKVAMRALFAGTIACFMTACIAGILYDESMYEGRSLLAAVNTTVLNTTVSP